MYRIAERRRMDVRESARVKNRKIVKQGTLLNCIVIITFLLVLSDFSTRILISCYEMDTIKNNNNNMNDYSAFEIMTMRMPHAHGEEEELIQQPQPHKRRLKKRFRSKGRNLCSRWSCERYPCCTGYVCTGEDKECKYDHYEDFTVDSQQEETHNSFTSKYSVVSMSTPSTIKEGTITYQPGNLRSYENGLVLSRGLKSKIIASSERHVPYSSKFSPIPLSSRPFHSQPDAAATFKHPTLEGYWIYVSNAEVEHGSGGVGAITFDPSGEVFSYKMILEGTSRNCGGGKSPFGTWISCEENKPYGQCYEVDPTGKKTAQKTLLGGRRGGNFESVAYDARQFPETLHYFVTNDMKDGELRRFSCDPEILAEVSRGEKSSWDILVTPGTLEYLVLDPESKTFSWSKDIEKGRESAAEHFPNAEGIDFHDGMLYVTSKVKRVLLTLYIDTNEYEILSVESGAFEEEPDQIQFLLDTYNQIIPSSSSSSTSLPFAADALDDDDISPWIIDAASGYLEAYDEENTSSSSSSEDGEDQEKDNHPILYFCEDSGQKRQSGIHGRDSTGKFFSIIEGYGYRSESTGLAFSPNKKFMYVAYQKNPGTIFALWREDGQPFDGQTLDIKYHQVQNQ